MRSDPLLWPSSITCERASSERLGSNVHPEVGISQVQIVIMHLWCLLQPCQRGLELLCSDEDVLKPLRKPVPATSTRKFSDTTKEIEILSQAGQTIDNEDRPLRYHWMPLPCRVYAQSGLHFNVKTLASLTEPRSPARRRFLLPTQHTGCTTAWLIFHAHA